MTEPSNVPSNDKPPLASVDFRIAPSRAEQLADRLVVAIALGEYVPGQRLPSEREFADLLGMGRLTVREALHRLLQDGYVDIRRGRSGGTYVLSNWHRGSASIIRSILIPNWELFEDLFELRRSVEALIARKAVRRHSREDLEALKDAAAQYEKATDREKCRHFSLVIRAIILRTTRNPQFARISTELRHQASLGFDAAPWSEEIRQKAIAVHDDWIRAFEESDEDFAALVAVKQVRLTEDAIRELVARVQD